MTVTTSDLIKQLGRLASLTQREPVGDEIVKVLATALELHRQQRLGGETNAPIEHAKQA